MTPSEFKAWFDGFTENMDYVPTEEQWKRIKARVAEIDGKPVTEKVFVDRYLPYVYPWYVHLPSTVVTPVQPYVISTPTWVSGTYTCGVEAGQGPNMNTVLFSSTTAMNALGAAEAVSLTG
jgi:hypothetical protein